MQIRSVQKYLVHFNILHTFFNYGQTNNWYIKSEMTEIWDTHVLNGPALLVL